ncbi:Trp operon leader peptide [Vibrio amylolyticus]|nr:Trp operon leader peptide [Vibrio sp. 10N.261.55.A7]
MLQELNQRNKAKVSAVSSELRWWRTWTCSKWVTV